MYGSTAGVTVGDVPTLRQPRVTNETFGRHRTPTAFGISLPTPEKERYVFTADFDSADDRRISPAARAAHPGVRRCRGLSPATLPPGDFHLGPALATILRMTSLPVDRPAGDSPFAELGEPILAVTATRRQLVAVAGADEYGGARTVGVFDVTDRARRRLLLETHFPVQAMAFHPTLPMLAMGTGDYDGGYLFEGELLLLDLDSGAVRSLIEHHFGRQVLGLEWLNDRDLRVLMAPPDDWKDAKAHVEGHVAVVSREDWAAVRARSLTERHLAGPRVPAPRPDGREAARQLVARLTSPPTRRHHPTGTRTPGAGPRAAQHG